MNLTLRRGCRCLIHSRTSIIPSLRLSTEPQPQQWARAPVVLPCQSRLSSTDSLQATSSAGEELAKDLVFYNHRKWGWPVFRCTYSDDEAWERFKVLLTRQSRLHLQDADVPRTVADGVDFPFISEPGTLDGASRDTLRQRFLSWVAEIEPTEQLPGSPNSRVARHRLRLSRYTYLVQVDEESLCSVVDADPLDDGDPGWVNLVRCAEGLDYNVPSERALALEEYKKRSRDDDEEYDAEDWIMLAASSVNLPFYVALGTQSENWHCYYSKPTNLVLG